MIRTLATGLVALVCAVIAAAAAAAMIFDKSAPDKVAWLFVPNGSAFATLSSKALSAVVVQREAGDAAHPQLTDLARKSAMEALMQEPLSVVAVRNLALLQEFGGNRNKSYELMQDVNRLTRRDPAANLWLADYYSRQDDLNRALMMFDQTLKTSNQARQFILPRLLEQTRNRQAVDILTKLLAPNPAWAVEYWRAIPQSKPSLENAAAIRMKLYARSVEMDRLIDQKIVTALYRDNKYQSAYELSAVASGREVNGKIVRNAEFSEIPEFLPFDWEVLSPGDVDAAVDQINGELYWSVAEHGSGPFARQLVALKINAPNRIVVRKNSSDSNLLYMHVRCAEPGKSATKGNRFALGAAKQDEFVYQNGECRWNWIELVSRLNTTNGLQEGSIDSIQIF